MDDIEIYKKTWNTCLELMNDREFNYDSLYKNLNDDEFKYLISNNNLNLIGKNPKKNSILYISFILLNKIKTVNIKDLIKAIDKEIDNNMSHDLIIVLKNKPTTIIKKLEKEYNNLQIMYCKQLVINPTKHKLVPKHQKINEVELNKLLSDYCIYNKSQLPIILRDDPIVRYYNFKSGDVLKIDASLGSFNTSYFSYRYVR